MFSPLQVCLSANKMTEKHEIYALFLQISIAFVSLCVAGVLLIQQHAHRFQKIYLKEICLHSVQIQVIPVTYSNPALDWQLG